MESELGIGNEELKWLFGNNEHEIGSCISSREFEYVGLAPSIIWKDAAQNCSEILAHYV